jgi:hypothetical protein
VFQKLGVGITFQSPALGVMEEIRKLWRLWELLATDVKRYFPNHIKIGSTNFTFI